MNIYGSFCWWTLLAFVLFSITFGRFGLVVVFYLILFFAGCVSVIVFNGRKLSRSILAVNAWRCPCSSNGNKSVMSKMEAAIKGKNFDKRMTGASVIDDALKEVLEYTVQDYIKPWYRSVSDHDVFLIHVWQCFQKIVIGFASRAKEVDWMPFITQNLVNDFASHIRLYRRASDKVNTDQNNEQYSKLLEGAFFDAEVEMEGNSLCHDRICTNSVHEQQYLQDLSEVLLYLFLPEDDFHSKPFRYMIREVLVNGIFAPAIDLLSDPDYINQYVAWLCYSTSFTRETFLTAVHNSDVIEELEAVCAKVEEDIAKWRSKDAGGTEDAAVKRNLSSLFFVRDTCKTRLKRLHEGCCDLDSLEETEDHLPLQSLYVMSLDDIMSNNTALQIFIEYAKEMNGGHVYIFFYLNVDGFRAAAAQNEEQSEDACVPDLANLRRAALNIYDQYLSDKGFSRISVESEYTSGLLQKIKGNRFSVHVFDLLQARVYQILHGDFYEYFLQTPAYIRLLSDLGLLSPNYDVSLHVSDPHSEIDDVSMASQHSGSSPSSADRILESLDDCEATSLDSSSSVLSGSSTSAGEAYVKAQISKTGIVKEPHKAGKSYAVFAVTVRKRSPLSEEEDVWDIYRRYSDFHDLRLLLQDKFSDIQGPVFPGKTMLRNMGRNFLEKRRQMLDRYLKALLKPDLWHNFDGLEEIMMQFLAPGLWEKHKSEFSRKMDTIVNPLRLVSKNVGQVVKNVPDGVGKVFNSAFNRISDDDGGDGDLQSSKVGANFDFDADNIPLRIMLLLLDEVFDLRLRNQWLRRRIVGIMRQFIKSTFGDTINRKIVDHVNFLTSPDQVAEYVCAFRDAFWPNGTLAEKRLPRDEQTKMRTRVLCKAKMLGSVSDEMCTLMGMESVRRGVDNVFNMFQHKQLNKRFLYVFLESAFVALVPDNKLDNLFRKQHSGSQRVKGVGRKMDGAGPVRNCVRRRQANR